MLYTDHIYVQGYMTYICPIILNNIYMLLKNIYMLLKKICCLVCNMLLNKICHLKNMFFKKHIYVG